MKKVLIGVVLAVVAFIIWNEKFNRRYKLSDQGAEAFAIMCDEVSVYQSWSLTETKGNVDLNIYLNIDPVKSNNIYDKLIAVEVEKMLPGFALFVVLGDATLSDAEKISYEKQMKDSVLQAVSVKTYYDINIRCFNSKDELVWHYKKDKKGGGEYLSH